MLALALLQVVALRGGTVHSMLPDEPARVATVLVEDGRIVAVGPHEELELPEDAQVVDCAGQHLAPGLIDAMVHHDPEHDALYTLAGVTLVRDMGNDIGRIFAMREPAARDRVPGPDLVVCGGVLDGVPPSTTEAVVVTSPDEVDDKLGRLAELGADFISFHLGIPEEAWRRAIPAAHDRGLQVWGPVPNGLTLEDVVAADQDGLLGLEGLAATAGGWEAAGLDALQPGIERMGGAGLACTPLLHSYAVHYEDPGDGAEVLELLAPSYANLWRAELAARRPYLTDELRARAGEALSLQRQTLLALWSAGVPLVPGSGAPNAWLAPGAGLHDELELWAQAGVPPAEVLRLATSGAARALGLAGERGAIAPGCVADIACLGADPTRDLSALREPLRLVLRGRVLERAELDGLRSQLLEAQALARERAERPLEVEAPELPEGEVLLSGLAHARALGQEMASERYAVVRRADGALVYCSRMASDPGGGLPPVETTLEQVLVKDTVQRFDLEIHRAGSVLGVRGRRVGGQLRVERRLDGVHLDTTSANERLAVVDAGSVTAALVLRRHARPGPVTGLWFEDATPAIGRWELAAQEDGTLVLRSGTGPWAARYDEHGGVELMERYQGSGRIDWRSGGVDAHDGPGLPRRGPEARAGGEGEDEDG